MHVAVEGKCQPDVNGGKQRLRHPKSPRSAVRSNGCCQSAHNAAAGARCAASRRLTEREPEQDRQQPATPGRWKRIQLRVVRLSHSVCLFVLVLLFLFQFSFLLRSQQGLFLWLSLAFVFTSLVTHISFSVIENECASRPRQASMTCSAHGPLEPRQPVIVSNRREKSVPPTIKIYVYMRKTDMRKGFNAIGGVGQRAPSNSRLGARRLDPSHPLSLTRSFPRGRYRSIARSL